MSRSLIEEQVERDHEQINIIVDVLFKRYPEGNMYFDEFVALTKEVTSELFFGIFDCLHNYVPCIKNFHQLKANFIYLVKNKVQ